jgi:riboflavin kinase
VSDCLAVLKEQGLDLEPVYFVTRGCLQEFALEHKEATVVLADISAVSTLQALGLPAFHVNCPMMQGGPSSFPSLEAFFSIIEAETEDSYSTWRNCIPLFTPNRIEGEVTRGFGRGSSQIGFPTANLKPACEPDVLPGIYAGTATLHLNSESLTFPAAISVGWNPQFDIDKCAIEAHILHKFTEDLYTMRVTLVLTHYLRAETVFSNLAELKQAIGYDVQLTEELTRAVEVALV